jgi:hypothetical protein
LVIWLYGLLLGAQFSGAVYHAINRGTARQATFLQEQDYTAFLKTLAEVHEEALEGTLLTSWTNWHTERESGGIKVCRGKQDSIVQGPCTT